MNSKPKIIHSDKESKQKVLMGMKRVTDPIKSSMGSKGNYTTVVHDNFVLTLNDGFSIGKLLTPLKEPLENIGANIVMSAGLETNILAGDSTSLAQVSTYDFCNLANDLVDSGYRRHDVYRVLENIKKDFIEYLDEVVDKNITEEKLINTAITSSKEPELGRLIGQAVFDTGEYGSVIPRRKATPGYELENYPGYLVETSFTKEALFDNQKTKMSNLKNPFVILYDGRIEDPRHVYPLVEMVLANKEMLQGQPILLFCKGIVESALEVIYANFVNMGASIYVMELSDSDTECKAMLKDLSVITGAPVLGEDNGIPVLTNKQLSQDMIKAFPKYMAQYPEIIVRRNETVIIYDENEKRKERIAEHIEDLQGELDELKLKTEEKYKIPKEELSSRMTKLNSKLKILRFGGDSQDRLNTLEFQLEDAINTARVAYKDGVVVGGGLTLINFFTKNYIESDKEDGTLSDENFVLNKLLLHFVTPHRNIISNAGFDFSMEAVVKNAQVEKGIDLNDMFGKLINYKKAGILDAKMGIQIAITKAITTAQQFVLTNTFVVDDVEDKDGK